MGYVFTVAFHCRHPTSYCFAQCCVEGYAAVQEIRNKHKHTNRVRQLSAPGFALVGKANDESSKTFLSIPRYTIMENTLIVHRPVPAKTPTGTEPK
jgi:hypothetical protein